MCKDSCVEASSLQFLMNTSFIPNGEITESPDKEALRYHGCQVSGGHLPSGTSLSLICCRQGTVLSSLTSVLVWNSSSRSAGCLDGSLGLDSGDTQHDTVFPIPNPSFELHALAAKSKQCKYLQLAKTSVPRLHKHYQAIVRFSTALSLRAKSPLSTSSQESHSCPFVDMYNDNAAATEELDRLALLGEIRVKV